MNYVAVIVLAVYVWISAIDIKDAIREHAAAMRDIAREVRCGAR